MSSFNAKQKIKNLKVALIHDFLVENGGAEKVLEALLDIWPDANVYTIDFWPEKFPEKYKKYKITTSFFSHLPFKRLLFNYLKIFFPFYFENLNLEEYDLIISDSANFAKGIKKYPTVPHISYIHTPPRFLWGMETTLHDKLDPITKAVLQPIEKILQKWDFAVAQRPDVLVANSETVKKRIKKFYKRNSVVINPPAFNEKETPYKTAKTKPSLVNKITKYKPFFFTLTRLVKYKRIDLLVEAFKQTKMRLLISGEGEEMENLKKQAAGFSNIIFLGRAPDNLKDCLYREAEAFIFPGVEDFGITMVEALSHKTPVIAYNKGGASEIVQKQNGILFNKQEPTDIINAIKNLRKGKFSKKIIKNSAKKFSKSNFVRNISELVREILNAKTKHSTNNIFNH